MPEHPGPSPPPPQIPRAGRPLFGDYEVEGELGRGGMGVVFRARQKELNRLVALKMLTGHYGTEERARFRAEAETAAHLRHTNIVQIYEVGEDDGAPFFSMEYIETGSLADRLRGARLPPREGAELLISVARALHFAHENGVVHRDMKPANVLLDRDGVPKVTDFGIAKRLTANSGLTLSGMVMGTPTYMAPEQAKGTNRDVGPAADIYALGAILYEILAGRPPFLPEESETALTVRVITEEPVSPAFYQPGIPGDLETICMKCLEKEPRHRYASATAFAEDLRRFLDDESIMARPPTTLVRAVKWTKRHPWRCVGWAALLLLLAATGQRLWQWEFYQRPRLQYATTVDYVNGALEPMLEITGTDVARHGVNLRLTRRGRRGPVTLVEVVNSRGNPAVLRPVYSEAIPIYMEGVLGAQPYIEKNPESATVEFAYDGAIATEATARDRNGSPLWRIIYNRSTPSQQEVGTVFSARFANLRGFEKAVKSGATQMELKRDAKGRDMKVSFFNGSGKPTPNGEGVHAYKFDRDSEGRIVRVFNLGPDELPAANRAGQIACGLTWDAKGQLTRIDMLDAAGQRALSNGVAAITIEYDGAGNYTRLVSVGADGKPAPGLDATTTEIGRNDRGEIIGKTLWNTRPDGTTSLYSQLKVEYDALGHPADFRFAGTEKWRTAMLHDVKGNVTEEKYLDAEGRPAPTDNGYAIKRFAHSASPQGLRIEQTYFDAAGQKTYKAGAGAGYHRVIDEFDITGTLRRQTLDEHDPAQFKYYRYVAEPKFDPVGRLLQCSRRFEDAQGQVVDAAKAELTHSSTEEVYDEEERIVTEWQLGCDVDVVGASAIRLDSRWHNTGTRKRLSRQHCDAERKPLPYMPGGVGVLYEEEFDAIGSRERIYEIGFNEKVMGFNVREARFANGRLQSVRHWRSDGSALESVRVIITRIEPQQPKAAEIKPGDQLLAANGIPVRSAYEWTFASFPGGWIEVLRDGQTVRIEGFEAGRLGIMLEDRALKN